MMCNLSKFKFFQASIPHSNPPATFQESDLVGTWEVQHYYTGCLDAFFDVGDVDRLIIRADGTFKQIYRNYTDRKGYVYETLWNPWWVERFSDGRVRLHLEGARYYHLGIWVAEQEGLLDALYEYDPAIGEFVYRGRKPHAFYDPIAGNSVVMVKKLILNVRLSDYTGELILMHLWPMEDSGYLICGGAADTEFHRVEEIDAGSQ